tara:strand:+ start:362 stop:1531 length:1170 start_codon:yes stop_codon:yes gene_type:complete
MPKYIIHIDMDAFFAAIEQRDQPELKGKPVIVGADPKEGRGRGVVSTCSYEARKFGIGSAMPISIAYKNCPQAVFLPVDMKKYIKASQEIFEILYTFTPKVQVVSIDEAFLDISNSFHIFKTPLNTCKLIKDKIKKDTGLNSSLGLAPTKMTAKIASEICKPNGLKEVPAKELLNFLWPLDIGRIWGLGKESKAIFNKSGIITIGDLARSDPAAISKRLGKNGYYFWQLARGFDDREVEAVDEVKSISNELTFEKDSFSDEEVESALMLLTEKVSLRLRNHNLKAKTITLKIRLSGFHTYSRSKTLNSSTNFTDIIYKIINSLYKIFNRKAKGVRLVGVKASGLLSLEENDSIFNTGKVMAKKKRVHETIDTINKRYGSQAICRAKSKI